MPGGAVIIELVGRPGAAAAEEYFAGRYGDAVVVCWRGPSALRETPHPFGSWTSDGRVIRVFFGLDHNGPAARRGARSGRQRRTHRDRAHPSSTHRLHHDDRRLPTPPRRSGTTRARRRAGRHRRQQRRRTAVSGPATSQPLSAYRATGLSMTSRSWRVLVASKKSSRGGREPVPIALRATERRGVLPTRARM